MKIGIVGLGNMGQKHAKACSIHPDFELVAGCSRSEEKRSAVEEAFGAWCTEDYRALAGRVDAVIVATPTGTHAEIARFFLGEGVHVLLEKPVVARPQQADGLTELARERGKVLQVGHIERYNPAWVEGMAWWQSQGLGAPQQVRAHRLSEYVEKDRDTGVTLDLMIHDVELVLSLYDARAIVTGAQTLSVKTEYDDFSIATLRFSGEGAARISAGWIAGDAARLMQLDSGDGRTLEIDFLRRSARVLQGGEINPLNVESADQLQAQLTAFSEAMAGGRVRVSAAQAARALGVCFEILQVDRESRLVGS